MTQNEVTLSAITTSDLCQKNRIPTDSTNMQEIRRGGDTQEKGLVANQHTDVGRMT